jgi:AcrR family transcriptional regulator
VDRGRLDNRLERRKMQTRAALIGAAQAFIAAGTLNVPVQEITQAADVGIGSFYNHFETKEELFQAAVDDALDAHGALLDRLTESLDDPAEAFAQSYRLTGRLQRRRPDLGRLLLNVGMKLLSSDIGLAPRALRDITAAARAGRFTIDDPERAVALAAATLSALGQLLEDHPERDDAATTDRMAEDLLHIYGLPADEAHEICRRPLPDLDALVPPDSAA